MNEDLMLGNGIPPIGPKVDPRDYKTIKCEKCGGMIFDTGVVLKEIPGTLVGNGTEPIVYPLQVLFCKNCGQILPADIKTYKLEKDFEENKIQLT